MPESTFSNVLLIYKKSKYQIYFQERKNNTKGLERISDEEMRRLKLAHEAHMASMDAVKAVLDERGMRYRTIYRARRVNYNPHDLVLAVGGDGTLIEATRCIQDQPILGINSDPERSVGYFSSATAETFPQILDSVLNGTCKILKLNRMAMRINGEDLGMTAMNDVLIAHHRPAAMSRYILNIGAEEESQLSSGVWISTAAGSSASMVSAGGTIQEPHSTDLQYLPRELFRNDIREWKLKGGTLPADTKILVTSRMRDGEISLDGCHCRIPLGFGDQLEITNAPLPVHLVVTGEEQITGSSPQI